VYTKYEALKTNADEIRDLLGALDYCICMCLDIEYTNKPEKGLFSTLYDYFCGFKNPFTESANRLYTKHVKLETEKFHENLDTDLAELAGQYTRKMREYTELITKYTPEQLVKFHKHAIENKDNADKMTIFSADLGGNPIVTDGNYTNPDILCSYYIRNFYENYIDGIKEVTNA
jgi:hypothetical protein